VHIRDSLSPSRLSHYTHSVIWLKTFERPRRHLSLAHRNELRFVTEERDVHSQVNKLEGRNFNLEKVVGAVHNLRSHSCSGRQHALGDTSRDRYAGSVPHLRHQINDLVSLEWRDLCHHVAGDVQVHATRSTAHLVSHMLILHRGGGCSLSSTGGSRRRTRGILFQYFLAGGIGPLVARHEDRHCERAGDSL